MYVYMWYFPLHAPFFCPPFAYHHLVRLLLVRLGCVLVCRRDLVSGLATLLRRITTLLALGRLSRSQVRVGYAFAAVDRVQRRNVCATDHR